MIIHLIKLLDKIVKDLEVLFNSRMEFVSAMRNLGFIVRNCISLTNQIAFKTFYYALVCSGLEYAAIILNQFYQKHANAIKNVQRRVSKHMYFMFDLVYPRQKIDQSGMLARLEMQPLKLQ